MILARGSDLNVVSLPARTGAAHLVVEVGHEPSGLVLAVLVAAGAREERHVAADVRVVRGVPDETARLRAGPPYLAIVEPSVVNAADAATRVQDGLLGGAIELSEVGRSLVEALLLVSKGFSVMSPGVRALALDLRGVSSRGVRVLQMIRRGDTNEAIARRMGLSMSTVKREVAALFDHYDVRSRAELVARTHAMGAAPVEAGRARVHRIRNLGR